MEFILELLLEFLLQILGQILGDILGELYLHSLGEPFRRKPHPWLAALGYTLFGAIFGGISLWLFPEYAVKAPAWRWVNLVFSPILAGLCMVLMGAWRLSRGLPLLRIDRFFYGYLFALSLALVRFSWAH